MAGPKRRVPRAKLPQWIYGAFLLVCTVLWCVGAIRVVYYAGDGMIGFHPLILFMPLAALGVALLLLITLFSRHWYFAGASLLALGLLVGTFFAAMHTRDWAWDHSIANYKVQNERAVALAPPLPELNEKNWGQLPWATEQLPILPGFQWYDEHPSAAPDGQYRAFRHRGFVFVRVQKIRNGWIGLVYLPNPGDAAMLTEGHPLFRYRTTQDPHWMIWQL